LLEKTILQSGPAQQWQMHPRQKRLHAGAVCKWKKACGDSPVIKKDTINRLELFSPEIPWQLCCCFKSPGGLFFG
jgi:hypothetical protein